MQADIERGTLSKQASAAESHRASSRNYTHGSLVDGSWVASFGDRQPSRDRLGSQTFSSPAEMVQPSSSTTSPQASLRPTVSSWGECPFMLDQLSGGLPGHMGFFSNACQAANQHLLGLNNCLLPAGECGDALASCQAYLLK